MDATEKDRLKNILNQWNSWWYTGDVEERKKGVSRPGYLHPLIRKLERKEILAIMGVRRSGKSVLVFQLIAHLIENNTPSKNIIYLNLDHPAFVPFLKDPMFLDEILSIYRELHNPKGRLYLFLDEIQEIPYWEKWVKTLYDMEKDLKIVLTGSTSRIIQSTLASSRLSGRYLKQEVYPLSFREYLDFKEIDIPKREELPLKKDELAHHFGRFLDYGGFPEVVLEEREDMKKELLIEYFNTIVYRDIVSRYAVRYPSKLKDLVYFSLANISNPISYTKIAKFTGLTVDTVKEYLLYCQENYLLFSIQIFSFSLKQSAFIQMPRKVYCIDDGLRNAASMRFSKDAGRLLENQVLLELKRKGYEVFYWKNDKGWVVDFVIKVGLNVTELIQVCWDAREDRTIKRETDALLEAMKAFNLKEGKIITADYRASKKIEGRTFHFIPAWEFMLYRFQALGPL